MARCDEAYQSAGTPPPVCDSWRGIIWGVSVLLRLQRKLIPQDMRLFNTNMHTYTYLNELSLDEPKNRLNTAAYDDRLAEPACAPFNI